MDGRAWLDEVQALYREYKRTCERSAAQVSDEDFFASFGESPNSIAVLMKHLAGNHRSRWRDFLTTDGVSSSRRRGWSSRSIRVASVGAALLGRDVSGGQTQSPTFH